MKELANCTVRQRHGNLRTVLICALFSSVSSKTLVFPQFRISENSSITGSSDAKIVTFGLHQVSNHTLSIALSISVVEISITN